jgi:hypothetical protein
MEQSLGIFSAQTLDKCILISSPDFYEYYMGFEQKKFQKTSYFARYGFFCIYCYNGIIQNDLDDLWERIQGLRVTFKSHPIIGRILYPNIFQPVHSCFLRMQ